ncbi:MAG: transposase, partial [Gemmatimonadota bacterium]|nr:transposase [Gemmatimonadota bacterium]
FLGSIGDPQSYTSAEQVLKLAGLNLTTKESGVQKGTYRISKRGRAELRQQAYLVALGMVQKGALYRAEYEAMVARNGGKKKKALVAISRKVVRLMFSIARDCRSFTATAPPVS